MRPARDRLHILTALAGALDRREEVTALIADSDDPGTARTALATFLDTDDTGARAVLTLHWSAFTRARHQYVRQELDEMQAYVRALEQEPGTPGDS